MKILFVGIFNKPWSSNIPLVEELRKKDHYVKTFDYRSIPLKFRKFDFSFYIKLMTFLIYKSNIMYFLPKEIKEFKFYVLGNKGMNNLLLSEVIKTNYDLVILAKAGTINYKLIPIINKFSKTFYYFMDPLEIAHSLRAYKYASLCTWSSASTTAMNNLFKKKGADSHYILEGFDENIFNPKKENNHKELDVIFVGSKNSIREKYINYLRNNKINVECYGNGWENKPIYLKKLVNKYRKSKIILNFPRQDSGFSDRVFQAIGTKTFLLSKYCSDLERVFKRGIHLDWFRTPEECLDMIKFYLEHEDIREQISNEGYNYVLENFTWTRTIEKLIQIVSRN
ncbi:MAG: glycosyltransferase [Candidatus Lokiarchaeota archaeon]|nr:glycosyltransferase [Candidatus Lokiarchaeota archaeon]